MVRKRGKGGRERRRGICGWEKVVSIKLWCWHMDGILDWLSVRFLEVLLGVVLDILIDELLDEVEYQKII